MYTGNCKLWPHIGGGEGRGLGGGIGAGPARTKLILAVRCLLGITDSVGNPELLTIVYRRQHHKLPSRNRCINCAGRLLAAPGPQAQRLAAAARSGMTRPDGAVQAQSRTVPWSPLSLLVGATTASRACGMRVARTTRVCHHGQPFAQQHWHLLHRSLCIAFSCSHVDVCCTSGLCSGSHTLP